MAVYARDSAALRARARAVLPPRGLTVGFYETLARRRVIIMSVLAMLGALGLGQALLRIGIASVALPVGLVFMAAIVWKPRLGLFTALILVLLFEMNAPDPLMEPGRYVNYGLQHSLGISGFIASPLEMLLILTFVVWLVDGIANRTLDYRGGDIGWAVGGFFLAVLFGLMRGAAGAGDMYVAFWEARSLLYVGVSYMLAANLIRTRRHVSMLLGTLLVGNGLYALEGAYRYLVLVRTGLLDVPQEFLFNHEVVIFLSVLILQSILLFVVGGPLWMRLLGLMMGPIGLFTLFATQRRAGYIALAIAFLLMTLPWLVRHRKAIMLILIPSVVAGAIYLPLFWNNTGFLGQPARAVRSLYTPDERDASSNQYRDLEEINVRETIRSDPFLGVGFGREFLFVVPLPDLSWWPFWKFQPHHNILWVWLKVGGPGFAVFWILMFGSLAIAASRALTLRDRILTSFAYIAIASIVTTLIFCYVDLGLTNGRVTVFLGVVLGALSALRTIDITEHGPYPVEGTAKGEATEEEPPPPRPWSKAYQEAEAERAAARRAAREAAASAAEDEAAARSREPAGAGASRG